MRVVRQEISSCPRWSGRPTCRPRPAPRAGCPFRGGKNGRGCGMRSNIARIVVARRGVEPRAEPPNREREPPGQALALAIAGEGRDRQSPVPRHHRMQMITHGASQRSRNRTGGSKSAPHAWADMGLIAVTRPGHYAGDLHGAIRDLDRIAMRQRPASTASRMRSAVVWRPSRFMRIARCILTVFSDSPSSAAICLLSRPLATSLSTWP